MKTEEITFRSSCGYCDKRANIHTGFCQECMDNVKSVKDYLTREDPVGELLYYEWLAIRALKYWGVTDKPY